MSTQRAQFRTQWIDREDEVKPEPIRERQKRVRRLPLPGPGIVITVPLSLLPEYLQLHNLHPMTLGEVADNEKATKRRKPTGFLYVKRIKSEGK
jgi:hypothetical protein